MISKVSKQILSALSFCFRYKYTILFAFYLYALVFFPILPAFSFSLFSISRILGIVSIVFILHILSKTKYTLPLIILLIIIITLNGYFTFILSTGSISLGVLASILETNMQEAKSVLSGRLLSIFAILGLTIFLTYMSSRELKSSTLKRRFSVLAISIYVFSILPILTYRRILLTELRFNYHSNSLFYTQIVVNQYSPLLYGNIVTLATSHIYK